MRKIRGVTLIELIIFIVVISIAIFGALVGFSYVSRYMVVARNLNTANLVLIRCLEWYVGQRDINGYSTITSPSTTTPTFCSNGAPSGYATSVNVSNTTISSATYKKVQVTVTGPNVSVTSATILGDYS